MSVNLSALQFSRPEFLSHLELVLGEFGIDPANLMLEITESALLAHAECAHQTLVQLKERRIKLALDNFGTGYSSMANLRHYPIDALKIDRSFVGSMLCDPYCRELVGTTLSMAQNMKIKVVAEGGIETLEHASALKAMDCPYGQGFYFSPALAAGETSALLARHWVT